MLESSRSRRLCHSPTTPVPPRAQPCRRPMPMWRRVFFLLTAEQPSVEVQHIHAMLRQSVGPRVACVRACVCACVHTCSLHQCTHTCTHRAVKHPDWYFWPVLRAKKKRARKKDCSIGFGFYATTNGRTEAVAYGGRVVGYGGRGVRRPWHTEAV